MWCFQIDRSGAESKGLCEFEADQLTWLLPSFVTANIFTVVLKKPSQQCVCILPGRDSQAKPLGPGVCDPEYGKAQTIRAHAPVVAGAVHLLHWVSDPQGERLYTSNQVHWYCRHYSLASTSAELFMAAFEMLSRNRLCPSFHEETRKRGLLAEHL